MGGRDHQFFVRIVRSTLVQFEFQSQAITRSSGDAMKDQQFGYDCELSDDGWSLFCGVFFRDPSITKDDAGVRTALQKLFLCLHSWYNGSEFIGDCPCAWLNHFCQDLALWLLLMSASVIEFKDLLVRGWGEGGFLESFGSGVTMDRITRKLTSLVIAAHNLFCLWVETEMFRDGKEGDYPGGSWAPCGI